MQLLVLFGGVIVGLIALAWRMKRNGVDIYPYVAMYLLWDIQLASIYFYPVALSDGRKDMMDQMPEILMLVPFALLMPFAYALGSIWFLLVPTTFIRLVGSLLVTLIVSVLMVLACLSRARRERLVVRFVDTLRYTS